MKDEIKSEFADAVRRLKKGDISCAKDKFLKLSQIHPREPTIFAILGNVCWEMELLIEAISAFRRAIELRPRLEAVSLGLFHCLWELKRTEEAFEEMKRFQSISDSANYRDIVAAINSED